ncbi:MAG TPA: HupE/UreJ family protein [Candidatus Limnocylindria bacterium]|nr:HupE/UreJ family protein [Candidatus Limnocylindria bacterium]
MTGVAAALAWVLLLPAAPARGHAFDPALLILTEREPALFDVVWRTSPARVPPGRTVADDPLVPALPAHCRRVYPADPPAAEAGARVFWRVACDGALRGERLVSAGSDPGQTDVVVRVHWLDGTTFTGVLRTDAPVLELPHDAGALFGGAPGPLAWGYLVLGVQHILEGVDHLLFVLGLFLLVHSGAELVRTITAFTVAHSISLALATAGVLTLPAPPVEALIAASIVLVAREIARGPGERPTLANERPWMVAFAFGLLHGLGFAGALAAIGLPQAHAALALLAFNVGVEIGQLAFVALLFFVAIPFRPVVSQAPRLRLLPAYAMGAIATAWVVERVQAFWSVST